MKIAVFLLALSAGHVLCRDAVTVDPGSGGSLTDLSGTSLTRKYCTVQDRTCDLAVIEANFAGTDFQCQARCTQRRDCFAIFYNSDRVCNLLSERCAGAPDQAASGTYFHRLQEGESCPDGSTLYVPPENIYSTMFCMLWGKTCNGSGYYRAPANIAPMEACLIKCAKIKTCGMVNFNAAAGKCEPLISTPCPDENLADASDIQNFLRMPLNVTECPDNRGPPSVTAPPATPEPEPEPEPAVVEPTPDPKPVKPECGGKKYVEKFWGTKGQRVVVGECNAGCTMSVCHCRPWGHCDGARFTSRGKCRVVLKKSSSKKRIFAHIKCVPADQIKVQYISTQTPGARLQCSNGYKLGDCTFFAHRRNKWTKGIKGQGCGIRSHEKGCNRIGRCTTTGVCFKKV